MKHFEDQELCQFRLDFEKQLWCRREDSKLNTCGSCQSCICVTKLRDTTQWLMHARGALKLKFLTGVLLRCKSVDILESTQKIIQVALGKDFTYARSRQKPRFQSALTTRRSHNGTIDGKSFQTQFLETWDWFGCSKYWVKANYILGLLSLCDTQLLQALGNLIRVLIARERPAFPLHESGLDDLEDDTSSIPESRYSFNPEDRPELEVLLRTRSTSMVLDLPGDTQDPEIPPDILPNSKPSKDRWENLCLLKEARWVRLEALDSRNGVTAKRWGGSGTKTLYPEEPALAVVPGSSMSLSGVSRHRDFIRSLPVHLAKRILGFLDRSVLLNCLDVSQHWHYLTEEVQTEIDTKRMVENQAMIMQGSSKVCIPTVYSRIREVLVPTAEKLKDVASDVKKDKGFESAYSDVTTKTVEMEEKNMFCGAYNLLVLSSSEDSTRVVHYNGGHLVAVGSKDRLVRLLDVKMMKERSLVMQGHAGSIRTVYLCEERGLVISAGYDLSIRCWNLRSGVCTMLLRGHFGTINCLDLHGNTLVSGAKDCRVKVWNLQTGKCHQRLRFRHDSPVQCVRAGQVQVLSSCDKGLLKLWDLETGRLLKLIDSQQGAVKCLHLDQWHILSGGADGYVKAWSTSSWYSKSLLSYRHPREVLTLTFLFLRVVTGCADGKIRVFDFLSGNCLRVIISNSQQSPVLSLHIHNNNLVINTRTSVIFFQFGTESPEHSEPPEDEGVDKVEGDPPRSHPHSLAQAQSAGQLRPSGGMIQSSWKQAERDSLPHHAYSLSSPSMQWEKSAPRRPIRPATGSVLLGRHHSPACSNLQPAPNAKPHPALRRGTGISRTNQRPRTTSASAVREPVVRVKWGCSHSEGAEKKGLCRSPTDKHAPLEANVSQQPRRCNRSGCSIHHRDVGASEAWGSAVSPLCKQPGTRASLPGTTKPAMAAPSSAPSPPCHPSHSCQIRPFTASPNVGRPQTGQGLGGPHTYPGAEAGLPYGMGSGKTVRRIGAITTTAERDVSPDRRMSMSAPCGRSGRRVGFDTPFGLAPTQDTHCDPFRKGSLFRLLTVGQQEDREREVVQEHEEARTRECRREEKQKKRAWRMKAKGLPTALYGKEGQVHAPELGPHTYV